MLSQWYTLLSVDLYDYIILKRVAIITEQLQALAFCVYHKLYIL